MRRILHCVTDDRFTLKEACPACGSATTTTQPPKFSVEDRHAAYRRQAKEAQRKQEGLL